MRQGHAAVADPPAPRELKRRREEIQRRLMSAGLRRATLDRAPRWLEPQVQARLRGFRSELESLGPVFCLFGRYLGTRLDHLDGADCRDLAALSDHAEPIPEAEIRGLLRSEFGPQGAASVAHLEAEPVESLTLTQTHRGWLSDGRMVSVKLARLSVQSERDLAVLPHLAEYLSSLGWPLKAARRMLSDFADLVARRRDLGREAEMLGRLARLPGEPRLRVPRVVAALSNSRVRTIELPRGAPLFSPPGATARDEAGTTRILTDLWMRLVFDELQVPEELSSRDVGGGDGGLIELTGGLFHPISGSEGDSLWRYLVAAAREDPDGVFDALRGLATPAGGAQPQTMRHHLGHVVPRRDGRFGETPPGFPELLLSHWPQLERHGLVPGPALLAFYRGLVGLRDLTGPALSHRVLREALQVAQISRGSVRLRKTLDPSLLTRHAQGALKTLMELPRTLEASGRFRRPETEPPASTEGQDAGGASGDWARLAAGLLLAATFLIWFLRFPTLLGPWTAVAQGLALGALGLVLLRWIWKG